MNDKLKTLIEYQAWRRGAETPMPRPAIIGEAIDYAIEVCTAAEAFVLGDGEDVDAAYEVLSSTVPEKGRAK